MQQFILIPATIAAAACILDLKDMKIKNPLILTGYAAGFWYIIYRQGLPGILTFFGRALWPIALFYILFIIGALGAGDIKLFSVLSTFFDLHITLRIIIISFFAGGVIALFKMLQRRELAARLFWFFDYARSCMVNKRLHSYIRCGSGALMHFTVPIFIAFLITEVIS